MKTFKTTLMTLSICLMLAFLPVCQAADFQGVTVLPGDSFVWNTIVKITDDDGSFEESSYYRLVNITEVCSSVDSSEVTYNDYMTNSSSYEGYELHEIIWNETDSNVVEFLNNSDPMYNFGGLFNLEGSDLTDIEEMTAQNQTDLLINMMLKISPEFLGYTFTMSFIAFWAGILGDVNTVNSTEITEVKATGIAGSVMLGYSIWYDLTNTWYNLSTSIDFEFEYAKQSYVLSQSLTDVKYSQISWNEASDAYNTEQIRTEANATLVYPEDGLIASLIAKIPGFPIELVGVSCIFTLGVLILKSKKKHE